MCSYYASNANFYILFETLGVIASTWKVNGFKNNFEQMQLQINKHNSILQRCPFTSSQPKHFVDSISKVDTMNKFALIQKKTSIKDNAIIRTGQRLLF